MKKAVFILLLALPLMANAGGRCTGSANCHACTNCSRCKHCNSGGTCGVCHPVTHKRHNR